MVKLKNIKKNDSIIECDIYPESSLSSGHVVFDTVEKKLIEYTLPEGYDWCLNHVDHAADVLERMATKEKIPEEKLVMWY